MTCVREFAITLQGKKWKNDQGVREQVRDRKQAQQGSVIRQTLVEDRLLILRGSSADTPRSYPDWGGVEDRGMGGGRS